MENSFLAATLIANYISLVLLIKVTNEGELVLVDKIDNAAAVSDALSISEGQHAFAFVQHEDSKIHLFVKDVNDWNGDLLKERVVIDHQRGNIDKIFINNYVRFRFDLLFCSSIHICFILFYFSFFRQLHLIKLVFFFLPSSFPHLFTPQFSFFSSGSQVGFRYFSIWTHIFCFIS